MIRVLGSGVFTISDNIVCLDYICLFQDKLSNMTGNV